MVKILKRGTTPVVSKNIAKTCPYCGCVFTFQMNDILTIDRGIARLRCPDCNNVIHMDSKSLLIK